MNGSPLQMEKLFVAGYGDGMRIINTIAQNDLKAQQTAFLKGDTQNYDPIPF